MSMITPRQLKDLYQQGVNISQFLRQELGVENNTPGIIEIAYELQAGSYIALMDEPKSAEHQAKYSSEIARVILSLCTPETILEAGIGEATTFSGVAQNLPVNVAKFGFDISWSRVAYAKQWIEKQSLNATLCTGNLLHIPFPDNSFDIVYTSHAVEPNRGNELPILQELYRVTQKFLILLEPSYELASEEARRRMDSHKYCVNLKGIADELGLSILDYKLFPYCATPLNPTAILIIKKTEDLPPPSSDFDCVFACPKYKTPLKEIAGMLYSPEALMIYPIVGDIPCLRIDNGIFASKYEEFIKNQKE